MNVPDIPEQDEPRYGKSFFDKPEYWAEQHAINWKASKLIEEMAVAGRLNNEEDAEPLA